MRAYLPAFSDELKKISSDLFTPAVVSDSNAVTGPPATPFNKRKGYKKLEPVIEKEGAAETFALLARSVGLG